MTSRQMLVRPPGNQRNGLIVLILLAAGAWPAAALAQDNQAQDVVIRVDHGMLTINGAKLTLPCRPDELVAALGKPDREALFSDAATKTNTPDTLIWDDAGVYATKKTKLQFLDSGGMEARVTDAIDAVSIAMSPDQFRWWPHHPFNGTLTVDGTPIVASSTSDQLNEALHREAFVKDKHGTADYSPPGGSILIRLAPVDDHAKAGGANLQRVILLEQR
jgi:hypothetical protein